MPPTTPYTADLASRNPIEAIDDTIARIEAITAKWTPADFERRTAPGKWPARQILLHLAQSEIAFGHRARMALTVPHYGAQSMDQDSWMAVESGCDARTAATAYLAISRLNLAFFKSLADAQRSTVFSHPEYGALTVDWILHQTAGHQIHHLKQLDAIDRSR